MRRYIFVMLLILGVFGCSEKSTIENTIENKSSGNTMPQISVQLWSIKEDVKKDIKGTLTQLAEMGFDGVEFANEFGNYADKPEELKSLLDELKLVGSAAHVSFEQLDDTNFDKTVAFYQKLDIKYLIVPWDERAWSPDGIDTVTKLLNEHAEKLAQYGMRVGFHNHQYEFADYKGTTYWDYLAKNTSDNVILQLDVGWVINVGKDPVDYVKRYPGRTLTTHYKIYRSEEEKDMAVIIGDDETDWSALIKANMSVGGTEWIVIEQEQYPKDLSHIQSVAKSMQGLQKIIKKL